MRKDVAMLGMLAVLVLTNLATLALVWRMHEDASSSAATGALPDVGAPRTATASSGAPSQGTEPSALGGRLSEIDARLAALAQELRTLGERLGSAPAGSIGAADPVATAGATGGPAGGGTAAPATGGSKVDRLLAASQETQKFWQEMGSLAGVGSFIDPAEYQDLLLERTSNFLKLDADTRSRFADTVKRRLAEYETIMDEERQWNKRMQQRNNEQRTPEQQQEFYKQYKEFNQANQQRQRQFAQETRQRLTGILRDDDFTHKSFQNQIEMWFRWFGAKNPGNRSIEVWGE